MSFLDSVQADNDAALTQAASALPPPPKPSKKISAWADLPNAVGRVLGTAIPAAVAEVGAAAGEVAVGAARAARRTLDTPFQTPAETATEPPLRAENEVSRTLRNVAADLRPDPATASAAEQVLFGGVRGVGKAVGYVGTLGPAGAVAFAVDEGLVTMDDLQRQGVDDTTAAKAGAVVGAAQGVGVLLPMGGPTAAKTAGLIIAGGPGAFVAQQAATSAILERAGYDKIAEQFDPLDPVGLAVSTLIPAAFGGAHAAKLRQGARAVDAAAAPPPEVVDAAMVQNLSLAADRRAGDPVPPPLIEPPRAPEEPPPKQPAAKPEEEQAAARERLAPIEAADPEAAATMQRVRQEADEGTDLELGRQDADLLRVAAECALSLA